MLGKNEHGVTAHEPPVDDTSAVVEEVQDPEVPPEVESYVEQVETHTELQQPIQHQTQSTTALAQQSTVWYPDDAIVLPLTQNEFEEGMKSGTWTRVRWLAEWCFYLIKKHGERVFFKS